MKFTLGNGKYSLSPTGLSNAAKWPKRADSGVTTPACVHVLSLLLNISERWGKLLNFSEPQFSHYKKLLWGMNKLPLRALIMTQ